MLAANHIGPPRSLSGRVCPHMKTTHSRHVGFTLSSLWIGSAAAVLDARDRLSSVTAGKSRYRYLE